MVELLIFMALSNSRVFFRGLSSVVATLCVLAGQGQLVVNDSMTPAQLVQDVLLGGGVSVSNIVYNGVAIPAAAQLGSGSFTQTGDLGLDAGVILSSGYAPSAIGPEGSVFSSDELGNNGSDPDLEALVDGPITDYSILEFDFVPTGDSLQFRYVFGSEEYPGWICSAFNDAFGFFLSGPGIAGPYSNGAINIALLPDGITPVAINNVHEENEWDPTDCPAINEQYYVDNTGGNTISFGGFTTVLTAFAVVQCGATYHIKLAIADAGGEFDMDTGFDSAVFLEAGSFTSSGQVVPTLTQGPGVVGNTINEGCAPVELTFTRAGDLSLAETIGIVVSGSATPGVDYVPALPSQLDFAAEDSTVTFVLDVPVDDDGPEDMVITITQLVACANASLETAFTFHILSPEPLMAEGVDIVGACGEEHVLAPVISGGVGAYQFLWSTGETTPSIVVSPEVTTVYDFTVTDGCSVEPFYGSLIVTLPVYDPLQIEVSPPTAVPCLGYEEVGVVSVEGGNGDFSYAWSVNGMSAGTTATISVPSTPEAWYLVSVSDGCGETVQDSVWVTRVPLDPIVITTTPDVTVLCPGDSAVVSATSIIGGNGVYTMEWADPQGVVLGMQEALAVRVTSDVDYTLSVADQCGTEGSAQVGVRLPHYAQFVLNGTPDHLICAGDSSVLTAEVQGGSGYYYIDWVDAGWTDPVLPVFPVITKTYAVVVTDQCGQALYDEVTVTVEEPTAVITVENLGQDDWHLRAATVPAALTHVWNMGDGTRYRQEHVFHSYMDLEEHWVLLRTVTANGCAATDSVLLKPPAHVYFPNAFTPDGDGMNDRFGPVGHSIDALEITIFDRWGEAVFSSDSTDDLWDGRVNGGPIANTGVYIYKYRVAGLYFPSTEGYGHVTLLKGTQE